MSPAYFRILKLVGSFILTILKTAALSPFLLIRRDYIPPKGPRKYTNREDTTFRELIKIVFSQIIGLFPRQIRAGTTEDFLFNLFMFRPIFTINGCFED